MKILSNLFGSRAAPNEEMSSLSDMMSALMLIFLLTSISLLAKAQDAKQALEDAEEANRTHAAANAALSAQLGDFQRLASDQETTRVQLAALLSERIHADDLARWKAEFNEATLSFRFSDPETLFQPGSAAITPRFAAILQEFGPALMEALATDDAHLQVASLRVEGHTSSEWSASSTRQNASHAHIRNMSLSQDRAFSVVRHLSELPSIEGYWSQWASGKIQALGLGPNRLLRDEFDVEIPDRSRRVEVWIVPRNLNDFHALEQGLFAASSGSPSQAPAFPLIVAEPVHEQ